MSAARDAQRMWIRRGENGDQSSDPLFSTAAISGSSSQSEVARESKRMAAGRRRSVWEVPTENC